MVATMPVFATGNLHEARSLRVTCCDSDPRKRAMHSMLACILIWDVEIVQSLAKKEACVMLLVHQFWPLMQLSACFNHPVMLLAGFLQVLCQSGIC